jgi:hypothetical protein
MIGVMDFAKKSDIRWTPVPTAAIGIVVVKLETSTLGASPTLFIDERASTLVPLPHHALHRRRHVPRPRRRIRLLEALPRRPGFRKPFGLEPLELLGHGGFDDRRQVFLHERFEPLELLAELRTRCERHLEPRRRKGLYDGWSRRRRWSGTRVDRWRPRRLGFG